MLISDLKEKKKAKIVRKLWNNFFFPPQAQEKIHVGNFSGELLFSCLICRSKAYSDYICFNF